MKPINLRLTDDTGHVFTWSVWRDARTPADWRLTTHDDCERHAGNTWASAVPYIYAIAENYGLALTRSIS